jgi:hypothetical protein
VKALVTIAATIEQRRQMLGAYEYAMAAPRLAGSFKVKIDGPLLGSSATDAGHFSVSEAL